VKVLYISQEGHLWFQCQVPAQLAQQYEQNFPVRLQFFRKGHSHFVTVSGNAAIIKTLHHNAARQMDIANDTLLLRMDIEHAECTEPLIRKKSWFGQLMESNYQWILRTITIPRTPKSFFAKLQHSTK
jgi:hypothetical protein